MQKLPDNLNQRFTQILIDKNLPKPEQYFYTKWLRYYWDFCHKYHHDPLIRASFPLFSGKLQEKKQSIQQQNQAKVAIALLYEMNASTQNKQATKPVTNNHFYQVKDDIKRDYNAPVIETETKQSHEASTEHSIPLAGTAQLKPVYTQQQEPAESTGQSWVTLYKQLENEIKRRHYSPKTLKAYRTWSRQFQGYTNSKDYQSLCQKDVIDFLTWLAVERKVSASSQNHAFNALLFLF